MPSRAASVQQQLDILAEETKAGRLSEAARSAFLTIVTLVSESIETESAAQPTPSRLLPNATRVPGALAVALTAATAVVQ